MQAKVLRTLRANGIPQVTKKQPQQRVDEETPIWAIYNKSLPLT